jgi:hypothetical protein
MKARPTFAISLLLAIAPCPAARPAPDPTPVPASPCSSAEGAQFDFWIGDWDVRDASGRVAGRSRVSKILGGCVIHEEWSGLGEGKGFDGESFSTYRPSEAGWRQTWVDNSGKHADLRGGSPRAGFMSLNGEVVRSGRRLLTRLSWTTAPEGLRQVFESSEDAGATWKTVFEMRYARRARESNGTP